MRAKAQLAWPWPCTKACRSGAPKQRRAASHFCCEAQTSMHVCQRPGLLPALTCRTSQRCRPSQGSSSGMASSCRCDSEACNTKTTANSTAYGTAQRAGNARESDKQVGYASLKLGMIPHLSCPSPGRGGICLPGAGAACPAPAQHRVHHPAAPAVRVAAGAQRQGGRALRGGH